MATHSTIFLPGKSHGERSLAGYSPRSCKELDENEQLSTRVRRSTWELVFKNETCPGNPNMQLGLGPSTSQSLMCMWITWALALKYRVYRGGRF